LQENVNRCFQRDHHDRVGPVGMFGKSGIMAQTPQAIRAAWP
jgi:hypothetical protein